MKAAITHLHYLLPENKLTNEMLAEKFTTKPDRIYRATGIRERRILTDGVMASDIGIEAAKQAIAKWNINPEEIDFLIFCSHGFDYKAGVTGALIHHAMGLKSSCGVLDLPQGCTGYIYGLFIADSILRSGNAQNVLFIAADMPSTVIHPDDYELRILFGDAASVTLIEKSENGMGKFVLGTDGSGYYNLFVDRSHARYPADLAWVQEHAACGGMLRGRMKMNSAEIFHFSLRAVPPLIEDILAKNNITMNEVDAVVFHQANGFMLEKLRRKLEIPEDKFVVSMEFTGNTVSASIPIAIKNAMEEGRITKGMNVLIAGFGIGYCWGGTILKI